MAMDRNKEGWDRWHNEMPADMRREVELEADNERLRNALRKIAKRYPCATAKDMQRVAREALPPE
jgi:hypothetical protein